ncbi:hypothetical protein KPL71_006012 [Citrus sinensis]|uniref:Uncharacterized protein n=1 Tax=Citrus sinensis TaxID=2711 RepID=A0ACB8NJ30_CITSI|nr:hypothetical protein KPL71_006012 [Citrus sinensis]
MADWHGIVSKDSEGGEEFEEEDIWCYANESEESIPQMRKSKELSSGSSSAWNFHSAPRMIRRDNNIPTAAHEANMVAQQSSAPVNIPDWSKIYGKNAKLGSSSRNGSWVDGHSDGISTNGFVYRNGDYHGYYDDDDDEDDGENRVPPHEWLAKKLARNQISSSSVCEGVGRTLKGRDLSKHNANGNGLCSSWLINSRWHRNTAEFPIPKSSQSPFASE